MHLLGLALLFWHPWDMPLWMVKICSPILQDPIPLNVAHQTRQCRCSFSTLFCVKETANRIPVSAHHPCSLTCRALPCYATAFGRAVIFPFSGIYCWRNTVGTPMRYVSCPAWGSSNNRRMYFLSLRCQLPHPQAKSEKNQKEIHMNRM